MKKPKVYMHRKTKEVYLEADLEVEEVDLHDFIEMLLFLEKKAEQDPNKRSGVKINKEYYGYDDGSDLQVYYIAYAETEEEHKERVGKEVKALEEWQERKKERDEAADAFNKELREKRIKEMEEELAKLKEGL